MKPVLFYRPSAESQAHWESPWENLSCEFSIFKYFCNTFFITMDCHVCKVNFLTVTLVVFFSCLLIHKRYRASLFFCRIQYEDHQESLLAALRHSVGPQIEMVGDVWSAHTCTFTFQFSGLKCFLWTTFAFKCSNCSHFYNWQKLQVSVL